MVEISNSDRDTAVRYLQRLAQLVADDNRLQVVNLRRLSLRLAKKLERRPTR